VDRTQVRRRPEGAGAFPTCTSAVGQGEARLLRNVIRSSSNEDRQMVITSLVLTLLSFTATAAVHIVVTLNRLQRFELVDHEAVPYFFAMFALVAVACGLAAVVFGLLSLRHDTATESKCAETGGSLPLRAEGHPDDFALDRPASRLAPPHRRGGEGRLPEAGPGGGPARGPGGSAGQPPHPASLTQRTTSK
jgi:hypothetical protein